MKFTKEQELLRETAKKYMEIATLPIQREKMELWKKFNSNTPSRPMVTIDQLPWHELNYDGSLDLNCSDPILKPIEYGMKQEMFKWNNFPVDMVVQPFLVVPFSVTNSGYGVKKIDTTLATDTKNNIVSHKYENQLCEEEDLEKIKDMVITVDRDKSAEILETANYILGDIMPIYQRGGTNVRLTIWDALAEVMGVEDVYFDLIDRPEFIHAIMEKMTHSALAGIRQINELGLANDLSNLCHCSGIYTNELLPDFAAGKGTQTKYTWSCSMAQLFSSTSPAVTAEFEIPYMCKLASEFGMFYYGCCERLDDRLDIVEKLPNLKKVSCSPWSDREKFAEKLSKHLIMSNKPTPAFLAGRDMDYDVIRGDLERTYDAASANNINVEYLLKDVSTIKNDVSRLKEWNKIAMEVVNR
ncbi:MAG: hypothetical protein R3Y35_02650 [Clostridia bacterium]